MAKKEKKERGLMTPSAIEKRYPGAGLASNLFDKREELWLPSRCIPFNHITGGGIPYGKQIEIYGTESSGKTLAAIDFAGVTQSLGGLVLWDDAEQAFTKNWAELNGLDLSSIYLYNETAIEHISDWLADMSIFARSKLTNNEPILFICDSLAGVDCLENINSTQTDAKAEMGNRAKAIYKMLRIRNKLLSELGICSIFINQIRHKVGASKFEDPDCLNYNTPIRLVDGRVLSIGEIVDKHIEANVWSYNLAEGTVEVKPIVGWVKKSPLGPNDKWFSLITDGPGSKGGKFGIICTQDHGVLTDTGWKNLRTLSLTDKVLTHYPSIINHTLKPFLLGSFIGDSSLRIRTLNTGRYQLQDNENPEYLNWKLGLLKGVGVCMKKLSTARPNRYKYQSDYGVEWANWARIIGNRDPLSILESWDYINPLTLAIWFMDDGHLMEDRQGSIAIAHTRTDIKRLVLALSNMGLFCKPYAKGIKFTTEGFTRLSSIIREYIPEMMQYKLLPKDRGHYKPFTLTSQLEHLPLWVNIISINEAGKRNYAHRYKYDLTIKDNPNFFTGSTGPGFLVHNTTPGGGAMKFYAAQRMGFYGGKQIKEDINNIESRIGVTTSIRVKKNKVAPPRSTIRVPIYFNPMGSKDIGFDKYAGLLEIFLELGTLTRAKGSSMIYHKDKLVARGEPAFLRKIEKDDELRKKLIKRSGINTVSKTRTQLEELTVNRFPLKKSTMKFEKQIDVKEDGDEDE